MSNALLPHGLQASSSCTVSGVCSNSCPVIWWCYLNISSFAALFSYCLQSFPGSGSFPMSFLFVSGGQSIGISASISALNIQPLESHSKEIQPVHPKGNQSWIFIRRTDAEAETPILWPPDTKNWLIGKDPDPGKDWRWEKKGMTEDEMVGGHHQLNVT